MKVYIVVKYTDWEVIDPTTGEETYITETEIVSVHSTKADANFNRTYLKRADEEDNVAYDYQEHDMD